MKIEMSESLVTSWLKHVKHCIVVNTNWKASPYWTPAITDQKISEICNAATHYFIDHKLRILEAGELDEHLNGGGNVCSWQSMLLQTECDAVGVAHSQDETGLHVYAVESAFHRNGVQYSKRKSTWSRLDLSGADVTAWNIALKLFKNALSMYRWYGKKNTSVVFVAPMSSVPVEQKIIEAVNVVKDFYHEIQLGFDFELYFEHATPGAAGSFSECVKSPVNLAASVVDDTSELYLRGHVLDNGTGSIDVLMLDWARRVLNAESLDEMTGNHLDSAAHVVTAIDRLRTAIITVTDHDNHQLYMRQKSRFDRCHAALREYYAVMHGLSSAPAIADLQNDGHPLAGGYNPQPIAVSLDVGGVEVVLNPIDPVVFKQQLLQTHRARRRRIYADGSVVEDVWRADSFTPNSDLMGNIKSSSAYRTASAKGVVRIEFSVITQDQI